MVIREKCNGHRSTDDVISKEPRCLMLDALHFETFNLQLNLKFVFSGTAIVQKFHSLIKQTSRNCPQADLNNRPLHYKCNALPLSYRGGILAQLIFSTISVEFDNIL